MKRFWLLTNLMVLILLQNGCRKNVMLPEFPKPAVPGSRNYTWTLDTLNMPMNYISSVWGATPNDVWATGAGGTEYDRLMHYDGETWSTYTNEPINCGADVLFGFSAHNIWLGGTGGWGYKGAGIWHYNGSQWTQNFNYYVDGLYSAHVTHIWGPAPNDIYACGVISFHEEGKTNYRGFVLHYDGSSWKEVARAQFNSQFQKVIKNHNMVIVQSFGLSNQSSAEDVIEFYRVKQNTLVKLHSAKRDSVFWASLHVINYKTYFVIGAHVYEYLSTGKMVKWLSFPQPEFWCQIYGRNEADLFIAMNDGIAHYNGSDMEYLYKYPVTYMGNINDPLIFEKEVFFCIDNPLGSIYTRNMMLHGILTDGGE